MSNFIELILTVCTLSQPAACDERKLMLDAENVSMRGCVMNAMPYIAKWSGEHPGVEVTRWRCAPPGGEGDKI